MNTKEQENQLSLLMTLRIVATLLIWLGLFGFIFYRIWSLTQPSSILVSKASPIPVIKQENIDILSTSIKQPPSGTGNLTVTRPEPFD